MSFKEDLQKFTTGRLRESFDAGALDSYRAKVNNAFTLLVELKEVCLGYLNKNVKRFSTVEACCRELEKALKNKYFILEPGIYGKDSFEVELSEYLQKKEKADTRRMVFVLNSWIKANETSYLSRLFDAITQIVYTDIPEGEIVKFHEYEEQLYYLTGELSCQLLYVGYSKRFLFSTLHKLHISSKKGWFENNYNKISQDLVQQRYQTYQIIFKLFISLKVDNFDTISIVDNSASDFIPQEIKETFKNYFILGDREYFMKEQVQALDYTSAIKKSKNTILNKIDGIQHGGKLKIHIKDKAFIYQDEYSYKFVEVNQYLDGSINPIAEKMNEMITKTETVFDSNYVDTETKERLKTAIRHLRLANNANEVEQQFINYWLALEFLFSSPQYEISTFERIKYNLTNILVASYLKRNILYVNKKLQTKGIIKPDVNFWDLTEEELTNLRNSITDRPLWQFRLTEMKSLIYGHKDKRKDYLKKHLENVEWHLIRMYRLRNELVHEAAIKQNIQDITSNLRYYLVFTINQLINWLLEADANKESSCIDDMFFHYDIYKNQICKDYDFKFMMGVKIDESFIK